MNEGQTAGPPSLTSAAADRGRRGAARALPCPSGARGGQPAPRRCYTRYTPAMRTGCRNVQPAGPKPDGTLTTGVPTALLLAYPHHGHSEETCDSGSWDPSSAPVTPAPIRLAT